MIKNVKCITSCFKVLDTMAMHLPPEKFIPPVVSKLMIFYFNKNFGKHKS